MDFFEEMELQQLKTAAIQNGFEVVDNVWSETYQMWLPKTIEERLEGELNGKC